jgi:hypothetical protein
MTKKKVDSGAVASEKAKSSFNWWAFWGVAVSAYTYFFGYNSKLYYLNYLGFDAAEISADPGAVYHFAFSGLLFINYKLPEDAFSIYLKLVFDDYIYHLLMFFLVCISSYFILRLVKNRVEEKKSKSKKSNSPENKIRPSITSFIIGLGYLGLNALAAPLVVFFMILISVIFSPALYVGKAMASHDRAHLNCNNDGSNIKGLPACNTLIMANSVEAGRIIHRDSQYIYLYTDSGPLSVPLGQVLAIQRFKDKAECEYKCSLKDEQKK